MHNFILQTDSYKLSHPSLYPKGLTSLYAYFESRGGIYEDTLFFGLQGLLEGYFVGNIFNHYDIEEASQFCRDHFGNEDIFPHRLWSDLLDDHGGTMPLAIKAVPEGMVIPTQNVLFTVENTDDKYAFLVNHVETLLMKMWYPTTIATQSYHIKKQLRTLREKYSDDLNGLDFMMHDFGYRGCTSEEQAAIGGAAHLLSFAGTDTIAGIMYLNEFYHGHDLPLRMFGFSVPATEHSVIMAHESEEEAFAHVLDAYPDGIVACVSDTRNIFKAVGDLWGNRFKDKVLARGGTLVVRPDSGDPRIVVVNILDCLARDFGSTTNSKGLRVLNPHVRVIQGDGMNRESIIELYEFIISKGYAPENLTVGAGGGMIQGVNRDTQRFAYKVSEVAVNGVRKRVKKTPITDSGKHSKEGRLALLDDGKGGFRTQVRDDFSVHYDVMTRVYENGQLIRRHTVDEIVGRIT